MAKQQLAINKKGADHQLLFCTLLLSRYFLQRIKKNHTLCVNYYLVMAEEEGFEPPRRFHALSVFKTDPFSRTWVFLRISCCKLVDPVGLEPTTDRL